LLLSITSCGSINSTGYISSDGIYGESNNVTTTNSNGIYYKNYFDQKAQEYGLNTTTNDSIITDINSYSSTTNTDIAYNNSYGSWGDNPDSVNINFRDHIMGAYWSSFYSPFYMNSWYMNPWNRNFYSPFYSPYGYYPYEGYGGYSYWDYMFRPYGYGGYYGRGGYYNNYNQSYDNRSTAYMNGRRTSGSINSSSEVVDLTGKSTANTYYGVRNISNYNVSRNDLDVNDKSKNDKSLSNEVDKSRNINRIYYSLKNLTENSNARGYQNQEEINNNGGSNTNIRSSNGKSNFQLSRRSSNGTVLSNSNSSGSRSYNVSRTSNGNINSSDTNSKSYNVSRSSSNSGNSSSKPSYSPPSTSSSSSSSGRSSTGSSKRSR
ncbi:MAG: hypothetical protein ABR90_03100, partial [Cryomorphaceae bacterium BACL29 MAG-121220-bin8]